MIRTIILIANAHRGDRVPPAVLSALHVLAHLTTREPCGVSPVVAPTHG